MTDERIVEESIKHSIRKNGFPEKRVRLPFKPVYKSCGENRSSLANVLENLKEEGVLSRIEGDHILFMSPEKVEIVDRSKPEPAPDFSNFSWLNAISSPEGMKNFIQSNLFKLDPAKISELRKLAESMSDDDKRNLLKMLSQLSNPPPEK